MMPIYVVMIIHHARSGLPQLLALTILETPDVLKIVQQAYQAITRPPVYEPLRVLPDALGGFADY